MNTLDKKYQDLLQDIIDNGVVKKDRTGTGTISVFGRQIRHNMKEGFPILTTKKMPFKTIVTELLWFLRGDTNIKYLLENGCHIWDGDAYKNYISTHENFEWTDDFCKKNLKDYGDQWDAFSKEEFINKIKTDDEFAKKWGDLGPIYGKQWRSWESVNTNEYWQEDWYRKDTDQIQNLINNLKTNPDSRRLMVSAWNVGELNDMILPPCHYGFQVYTRELSRQERNDYYYKNGNSEGIREGNLDRPIFEEDEVAHKWYDARNVPTRAISLMWNQRSVDTFLGLPFNIASYGLLLEIIAREVNMVPDELIGNLGDTHLYLNHIEQAKEQIGRKYTPEERSERLKEAMGHEQYNQVVKDLVPFGGGLSEYYDIYKIPYTTRDAYELPKLNIKGTEPSIIEKPKYWRPDDFVIENYKSHPTIKAPLSN